MRSLLYPDWHNLPTSIGLLFLRVVVGAAFIFHGWPKIQAPFGWMGPDAPVPGVLQFLAALAEFAGGIALGVGLLSRLAALGIASTMAGGPGVGHHPRRGPLLPQAPAPSVPPRA